MSGNKNEDEISKLHPRNKHLGLYDFKSLTTVYPNFQALSNSILLAMNLSVSLIQRL